jgi:beta-1,4-mannosyltransferase
MIVALAHFVEAPKENPYVWSLGTALQRQGHDVLHLPSSSLFLLRYSSAWRASTIHFQWFETLVGADSRVKMFLKSIVFLAQLKICALLGKRLIWTAHNAKSHELLFPRLERWVVRRIGAQVHTIIVHCDSARTEISQYLAIDDQEKFSVIDHGNYVGIYADEVTEEAARRKLGLDAGDMVILFLGNIRPYKGLDDLITSFQKFQQPGVKLLIAGKPLSTEMQNDIESRCGKNPDIIFHPAFIADDDIQLYLRACNVVAFPYKQILASGAVILAMSFGKPCIAPDIGCISSIITRSGNYLYSPVGLGGLDPALEKAIKHKDELAEMGAVNYERAKELDWDRIAGETALLYK